MKPYLVDGIESDAHDIILAARPLGYWGSQGVFKSSEAADVLRKNGKKVEENPNFKKL